MEIVFSLLLVVLVYALFKTKTPEKEEVKPTGNYQPYAAVKIDACDFSCSDAFDTSSQTFLLGEAPSLPLAGCDCQTRCKCKLMHFNDRRQNHGDRRSGSLVLQDVFTGDERRRMRKRGRRYTDYQAVA